MAQIAWTSEAQRWLRDIHNYIASDNPDAAERVALEIHDSVRVLHEHPRVGQRYPYVTGREVRFQSSADRTHRARGFRLAAVWS